MKTNWNVAALQQQLNQLPDDATITVTGIDIWDIYYDTDNQTVLLDDANYIEELRMEAEHSDMTLD